MKKKIAIVISAMNLGGAQRVVSFLCDHWSKQGYQITLISTYIGDSNKHYEVAENICLRSLDEYVNYPRSKYLKLIWKIIYLRKIFKEVGPDKIVSFLTRVNVASAFASKGLKIPLILCERTWTPFARLSKNFYWFYRILFRNAQSIVVQTEQSKEWLNNNFPRNYVDVIPNSVIYPLPLQKNTLINPDLHLSKERKIILASGRFHTYKQFDLLIKAFAKIQNEHTGWDLVILGDGEERFQLEELIYNLDLEERVFLPGSVGNIADWYKRSQLFILCSLVEGFPNVLLEAMAYGLPCISFDCDTGPRDMIDDGINGILVDPNSKEVGLSEAIVSLIKNPKLRSEISKNSLLIQEKFSPEHIMKLWDKILER